MAKKIETALTLDNRQFTSAINTSEKQVDKFGNNGAKKENNILPNK